MSKWSINHDEAEHLKAKLAETILAGRSPVLVHLKNGAEMKGIIFKVEVMNDHDRDRSRGILLIETSDALVQVDALELERVVPAPHLPWP